MIIIVVNKPEDKLGKLICKYFTESLLTYVGVSFKEVTPIPTEILSPDIDHRFLDYAADVDGKFILNIEFQKSALKKNELNRFMKYAGDIKLKTDKDVYSYIICTGDPKNSIRVYILNEDSIFRPKIFFLSLDNADKKLKKIENKINNQELLSELEMAWLVLIPFMNSKYSKEELTSKVCELSMKLIDIMGTDGLDLRLCMFLLIEIFVDNENEVKELKKVINLQGSYTQRVIEGIKQDIRDDIREEVCDDIREEIYDEIKNNLPEEEYQKLITCLNSK